jgi:hypothetical protein
MQAVALGTEAPSTGMACYEALTTRRVRVRVVVETSVGRERPKFRVRAEPPPPAPICTPRTRSWGPRRRGPALTSSAKWKEPPQAGSPLWPCYGAGAGAGAGPTVTGRCWQAGWCQQAAAWPPSREDPGPEPHAAGAGSAGTRPR